LASTRHPGRHHCSEGGGEFGDAQLRYNAPWKINMGQTEKVRTVVDVLLDKAKDGTVSDLASAVDKATGAMKACSEIEATEVELRKLELEITKLRLENDSFGRKERSERFKEYVALLAPIVTIATLGATLAFQTWQFTKSEKDKADAALDAQWEESVKAVSQTAKLSPGVVALRPFLASQKYGDRARLLTIQLLSTSPDSLLFDELFGAAFVPVSWSNLDDVLKVARAQY